MAFDSLPDEDPQADREQRAVQSVEVGGRLLLALAEAPGALSLKDLAARAALTPSRAHPYLVSFGRLRLIEQDGASGHYRLGMAALRIGLACLGQLEPLRLATPVAEALAHETGQAVALAVWGNFGPTIVRMFEAREPLHLAMRVGTVMSVLGTATGRAFAAVLSEDVVAAARAGALGDEARRPRPAQPTQAELLRQARDEWSRHGVTRAQGHPIPGVNAFSSPVFDHEGNAALAITALGHRNAFPAAWNSAMAARVRAAAAEISARLGGRMPPFASGLGAGRRT
ncbi:MAG TPA: IclR family transcriptional regulator [Burkholderiaceae bacterium]|nr:IclR family transcriptional regulator [Burkholderiaceae bacterium]